MYSDDNRPGFFACKLHYPKDKRMKSLIITGQPANLKASLHFLQLILCMETTSIKLMGHAKPA